MRLLTKGRLILIILFSLVVTSTYVAFNRVDTHYLESIEAKKELLLSKSISLFEAMLYSREWNVNLGGVYVKQKDGLEPNPYLIDNSLSIDSNNTFVKINPAWMTRQLSELMNKSSDKYYRITSLKPLNPENAPDDFEVEALKYLEENPSEKYYYKISTNTFSKDKEMYNFMGKLDTKVSCLECHAGQGYKVGDVRGGIRISIPIDKYEEAVFLDREAYRFDIYLLFLFVFMVLAFISIIVYIFRRREARLEKFNNALDDKVKERTKELDILNAELETRVKVEVDKSKDKDKLLIAQSRHAAMGEMISMIAHQWRQPLSSISMDCNSMMIDIEMDEIDKNEFKDYATGIIEQTEHLSNTIDDFRNFFRQDKDKESVLVSEVVSECFKIIGESLKSHGITYEVKVCEDESRRDIYSRELLQVLINILNNSKDAMGVIKAENPKVIVDISQTDGDTIISICDNGGGISEDVIQRIFEPYFTTKEKMDGTGLGLYMSKMIVESSFNGKIEVQNKDNGVCFYITLVF